MNDFGLDLAVIGNGRTAALVEPSSRIVWWCYPRFDGDPTFSRLLAGGQEKGFCDVLLDGMVDFSSEYVRNTAIVSTVLTDDEGTSDAYSAGIPGNGKPFPDGAKMAKIHWNPKMMETFPTATVPGTQHDMDFMVKDSKRFADSGGWGWAVFEYDAASDTFRPGNLADRPPQANDAKCGFACHTIVKTRDYVFTEYGHR
jgi:Cytochrome P460/Domain of unknown function (DUF5911)